MCSNIYSRKSKNMNVKVFNVILKVNEARVLVQHHLYECKCRLNEIYVIHCKNRSKMNVYVNAKHQLIGVLVKKVTYGIVVHVIVSVIKCVELASN